MALKVAVLVDGGFFIKRYRQLYAKQNPDMTAKKVADDLFTIALSHVDYDRKKRKAKSTENHEDEKAIATSLYRIFFYNCPPLNKRHHQPISNKAIDFSKTEPALFYNELHAELKKKRKLALRMGELLDEGWRIKRSTTKQIIKREKALDQLTDDDFEIGLSQKQVDMKIGLDIAALAYKKLVDRIVLISGDSDFIPAAKVARREGIDFVLDPMWQSVSDGLYEHIDGLQSTAWRPEQRPASQTTPETE